MLGWLIIPWLWWIIVPAALMLLMVIGFLIFGGVATLIDRARELFNRD